jgi:hypothetical protein
MQQLGLVITVNIDRHRAVVQLSDGKCTVFEWLSGDTPNLNEQIEGDLQVEGAARLRNVSTGRGFDARIHAAGCSASFAITLAR